MDLAVDADRTALRARLGRVFAERPVILAPGVLAGFTPMMPLLREARARRPLIIATHRGAGPVPTEEDADIVYVEAPEASSVTDELRAHDGLVHNLPQHARDAVETYDPERAGVWFTSPFVTTDDLLLGRPLLGGRPAAWLALEDKLLAEEIWEALDIDRAPSRTVPVTPDALAAASTTLDTGRGVVWSGDARNGFNGGGNYVRWVVSDADRRAGLDFFSPRCDRVRVMPFLEGVPCSIHGMVLPDGTATFRPVEIAILRSVVRRQFVYGGLSSFWDPAPEDRAAMRELARRTGELLRERHDYRGAFGIDGVLTADGFRPTELNSRMSAGLTTLAGANIDLFTMLQATLVAGLDPGVDVAALETLVVVMDEQRVGKVTALAEGPSVHEHEAYDVAWDGSAFTRSDAQTGNHLVIGATPTGFFARIDPCDVLVVGDRMGPLNVALMAYLDAEYDAEFGALTPAPSAR